MEPIKNNEKSILSISKENAYNIKEFRDKNILGFKTFENKEIFTLGCALGLDKGKPLRSPDGFVRTVYFKTENKALFISKNIYDYKSDNDLQNKCIIENFYKDLEEQANEGLNIFFKMYEESDFNEEVFAKKLLLNLRKMYNELKEN